MNRSLDMISGLEVPNYTCRGQYLTEIGIETMRVYKQNLVLSHQITRIKDQFVGKHVYICRISCEENMRKLKQRRIENQQLPEYERNQSLIKEK